jgi:hypothetical protein
VSLNRVVNLALLDFLGGGVGEELRLRLRLFVLVNEERELRSFSRTMLRSGSFLPEYAAKLLGEPKGKPFYFEGRKPLDALNPVEADVVRRILARREEISREIAEVLGKLLPEKRFVLGDDSESLRSDRKNCNGGEGEVGKAA